MSLGFAVEDAVDEVVEHVAGVAGRDAGEGLAGPGGMGGGQAAGTRLAGRAGHQLSRPLHIARLGKPPDQERP